MPSSKQDQDFVTTVIGNRLLDESVSWIQDNLEPYEVFTHKQLIEYATGSKPEEVFGKSELENWAESNGYIKK